MTVLQVLLTIAGWIAAVTWMFVMVMRDIQASEQIKELQARLDALEDKE